MGPGTEVDRPRLKRVPPAHSWWSTPQRAPTVSSLPPAVAPRSRYADGCTEAVYADLMAISRDAATMTPCARAGTGGVTLVEDEAGHVQDYAEPLTDAFACRSWPKTGR